MKQLTSSYRLLWGIGIILLNFHVSLAQNKAQMTNKNGIYLTLDDYLHHRLLHPFSSSTKGYHFRLPRMSRLKLVTPDSTYTYSLEQIFGYREDGVDWCYKEGYLVEIMGHKAANSLSQEGLWLFSRQEWAESGSTHTYFFSKNPKDELIWFSIKKIRDAYQDNPEFLDLLKLVPRSRLLDDSNKTGEPLILDIFSTAHKLHFSYKGDN